MRVGVDATPLLGRVTGIGVYTREILRALAAAPSNPSEPSAPSAAADEVVATAFTLRGSGQLDEVVPPGVSVRARPVPARGLRAAWSWTEWPTVDLLCGPVDVFHATNFMLPPPGRAAGVLTVHDLAYLTFPETVSAASRANRELVPRGLARARVVVTPSAAVAEQVRDAYAWPQDRVVATPLGVDAAWGHARPAAAEWLAAHDIPTTYLLAVGTLEPRKNLQALVRAHRDLADRHADIPPLVLVGGTGWGEALRLDGVRPGAVRLTGHLPIDELRSLVAGAQALVFPSLDEGFGLPPLEALACGVPVLASDLPVTREVLGDQALFCDASDPEALRHGLMETLADPVGTPATRRGRAGGFTWQRCARLTREAYARALALA